MTGLPRSAVIMIVKDEAQRVGRALRSVKGFVDTWLIIDTGSTDDTVAEIERETSGWSGVLLHREWRSFGENRAELIATARELGLADWLLTIDADHVVEQPEQISELLSDTDDVDAFQLPFDAEPLLWTMRLLRASKPWTYRGTTREYLDCREPYTRAKVNAPRIVDHADGASRADKYRRDADLLRAELEAEPNDPRRWYYLGESYKGLGQFRLANLAYTNCAMLTSAPEEKYLALFRSAQMLEYQDEFDLAIDRYLMANAERPARREALLSACRLLNDCRRFRDVIRLLASGASRPLPSKDIAGIVPGAYGHLMQIELDRARLR